MLLVLKTPHGVVLRTKAGPLPLWALLSPAHPSLIWPQLSQMFWVPSLAKWCGSMLPNSGLVAHRLKVNTREASVGRKESLLYSRDWQPGEKADSCPKASCLLPISWQELWKGSFRGLWVEGGATGRNSTVSSDGRLEIGHEVVWSVSFWFF